jgi:quinohemoprotein ethanol dehydrogenase
VRIAIAVIGIIAAFSMDLAGHLAAAQSGAVKSNAHFDETSDDNWPAYGRTFDESHYSPLAQINDSNVGSLGLGWYYDIAPVTSVHTAPLEVGGVLYFVVGYSLVHALDAKTGKLLWRYDPGVAELAGEKLKGGWGVRGIAYWRGKIYTGAQDGRLIAIDAKSGKPVWSVNTTESDDRRIVTGPPRVFNGKVIIGHGGADFAPVRGYVSTYDAETGKLLWRFYTVPGDPAKGFEDKTQAMAAATWKGEQWKAGGGGTAWNAITYDPELNRIYIGTGNGSPWNQRVRSPGGGDNLFLCSIVALDADTGQYIWHYQVNPGETWDYTATMDIQLATLPINGKDRRVLMEAPKNGFYYVIDRETGKLISAHNYARQNWAQRIDLKTGRPIENPEARFPNGEFLMYPGDLGAHSTQAMSFNAITRYVYIPAREQGSVYSDQGIDTQHWKPDRRMVLNNALVQGPTKIVAPPTTTSLVAWDPLKQKQIWSVATPGSANGGTVSTAGNLVFQGRADGQFVAYAADTGKTLWSFDAQTGIVSQPITYRIAGQQYVTVVVGFGGLSGMDGAAAGWEYRTQPRRVLTFTLNGQARLPTPTPQNEPLPILDDPSFKIDPQKAAAGARVFGNCLFCHGFGARGGGSAPDLRKSPYPLSAKAFTEVLHDGALLEAGMPRFSDLSPEEIEELRHYIRAEARQSQQ